VNFWHNHVQHVQQHSNNRTTTDNVTQKSISCSHKGFKPYRNNCYQNASFVLKMFRDNRKIIDNNQMIMIPHSTQYS